MKINTFRGALTDISAKKEALVATRETQIATRERHKLHAKIASMVFVAKRGYTSPGSRLSDTESVSQCTSYTLYMTEILQDNTKPSQYDSKIKLSTSIWKYL